MAENPVSKGIGTGEAQVIDFGPSEQAMMQEANRLRRNKKLREKKRQNAIAEVKGELPELDSLEFWYNRDSELVQNMYNKTLEWGQEKGWGNIAKDPALLRAWKDKTNSLEMRVAKSAEDKSSYGFTMKKYAKDEKKEMDMRAYSDFKHNLHQQFAGSSMGTMTAGEVKEIAKESGKSVEEIPFLSEDTDEDSPVRIPHEYLVTPDNDKIIAPDELALKAPKEGGIWDESMIATNINESEIEPGYTKITENRYLDEDRLRSALDSKLESDSFTSDSYKRALDNALPDLSKEEQKDWLIERIKQQKTQKYSRQEIQGSPQKESDQGSGFYTNDKGFSLAAGGKTVREKLKRDFPKLDPEEAVKKTGLPISDMLDTRYRKILDIGYAGDRKPEGIGELKLQYREDGERDIYGRDFEIVNMVQDKDDEWQIVVTMEEDGEIVPKKVPFDRYGNQAAMNSVYGIYDPDSDWQKAQDRLERAMRRGGKATVGTGGTTGGGEENDDDPLGVK